MPFDSKDFVETKPAVSLEGLIAWLETKDPATTYVGGDDRDCLFCRWLSAAAREPIVYRAGCGFYGPAFGGKKFEGGAVKSAPRPIYDRPSSQIRRAHA